MSSFPPTLHHYSVRRQPIAFGFLPSPRQDAEGKSFQHTLQDALDTRVSVKFRTTADSVRKLFPNENFSFAPDTKEAVVSYVVQSLTNLAWLGGGGYDLLGLNLHNVVYRKPGTGRNRKADYLPLMVENFADPILTGREELGVPKVFSDINISRTPTSVKVELSWRGARWLEIELNNLKQQEVVSGPSSGDSEGMIVHKYIPTTANPDGKPDADYDVLYFNNHSVAKQRTLARTSGPDNVRVVVTNPGPTTLPTLYPIAEALAQIPILEVLDATLADYQGVWNLQHAERLN